MNLKDLYRRLKLDYLRDRAKFVPEKYWSQFLNLGGASEFQFQIGAFVPKEKKNILVVGVSGGRDYFYFKARGGHKLWALDLFPDDNFENLIVGNIENENALPKNFFDAVIFCAVIEHLAEDYKALLNIRSALKDDGVLVLNTAYFGDKEETHIRIYSPKTLRRLVSAAGFEVKAEAQNPSLFWFPRATNMLHHAANALCFLVFGKTIYKYTLPVLCKMDYALSRKNLFLRRFSDNRWITTLKCIKAEGFFDYVDHNRKAFGPQIRPRVLS